MKIKAKYKKFVVYGFWFIFEDHHYLLLDTKSTKKTGLDVIKQEDLDKYNKGPLD